jgi:hypothetical protein
MIKEMIESQAVFAAKAGDGIIVKAPYRKFTPSPDLLKHYAKNLIGDPYGSPEIVSGTKIAGADLELEFANPKKGIGLRIELNIKRDEPLGVFEVDTTYFDFLTGASKTISLEVKPQRHNSSFMLFGSRSVDNEIFPELLISDTVVLPQVRITLIDGNFPDGCIATAYLLDLSDAELRDYVNSL